MIRPGQAIGAADLAQIIERCAIARQQQMIAVVDRHAERSVVIGAAAAAGEGRRLVHDDPLAAPRELDRGRQAGETGTDNVHRARHLKNRIKRNCGATMKRNFAFGRRTRGRGGAKPRAISPLRMR